MHGETSINKAIADMIVDAIEDYIVKPCVYIRREKNDCERV